MTIKNEETWAAIEEQLPFTDKTNPRFNDCWHWLEKLQRGGHLRQIDIIQLDGLLTAVFRAGVVADR